MISGTFNCRRFTRTEFFINFDKGIGIVLSTIFLSNSCIKTRVIVEQFIYIKVSTVREQSSYESGYRDFSVFVDSDIDDIV